MIPINRLNECMFWFVIYIGENNRFHLTQIAILMKTSQNERLTEN